MKMKQLSACQKKNNGSMDCAAVATSGVIQTHHQSHCSSIVSKTATARKDQHPNLVSQRHLPWLARIPNAKVRFNTTIKRPDRQAVLSRVDGTTACRSSFQFAGMAPLSHPRHPLSSSSQTPVTVSSKTSTYMAAA